VKAGKGGFRPDTPSPARWKDHLQPILADTLKKHRVTNHLALPWEDAPAFMTALSQRTGASARVLELTLLCATRKSETLGARLSEFELDAATWTIPAERTKTSETHVVALSKRAAEIIREAWPTRVEDGDDPFLWPNPDNPEKHISTEAGKNLLIRMKMHEKTTTHGLRATFRSWCADHNINREDAERCLGHKIGNEVENVCQRSTLIKRRLPIMQKWNDFLESPIADAAGKIERAAHPAEGSSATIAGTPASSYGPRQNVLL
jgi:integrase